MKRSYAVAFEKDIFFRLPKECENRILAYLSLPELCRSLSTCSKRTKALVYAAKYWKEVCIRGMQNSCSVGLLRLHGRHFEKIKLHSMRISRVFCNGLSSCSNLQELDLRGIWKSSVVNNNFIASLSKLPLRVLLFGKNEVGSNGFQRICHQFANTMEEFDFNSKLVSLRSYYCLSKMKRLRCLTLRCCNHLDHTVVPMLALLTDLRTLQLSFLSHMSPMCVEAIVQSALCTQLETLVLNGMYLNDYHCQLLNRMVSLRQLSLCHPNMNSNVLEHVCLPELQLLTIFCSKHLRNFAFLKGLPKLMTLCLFRCALSVSSLLENTEQRPKLSVKVHLIQDLCEGCAVPQRVSKEKLSKAKNVSYLNLVTRPYPFVYFSRLNKTVLLSISFVVFDKFIIQAFFLFRTDLVTFAKVKRNGRGSFQ